jgi:FkbM family methyltransferase
MRNIFLDCGAHMGESVAMFLRKVAFAEKYEIHSFECNPSSIAFFNSIHGSKTNVTLHKKAVWTNNAGINFYLGSSPGCSVIKSEKSGNLDKENPIFVQSISLSDFIKENFDIDDNIVLKIDIEGAEYDVLPDLIQTGAIKYIKNLFGEWHQAKIDLPIESHDKLVENLKSNGLRMREWCAIAGTIGD